MFETITTWSIPQVKSVPDNSAQDKVLELQNLINYLQNPVQTMNAEIKQLIIEIITIFCEKIIGHELSVNPKIIQKIISELLEQLPQLQTRYVLSLNPEDAKIVELPDATIQENSSLNRGEVQLIAQSAEIDGRIRTRINNIVTKALQSEV